MSHLTHLRMPSWPSLELGPLDNLRSLELASYFGSEMLSDLTCLQQLMVGRVEETPDLFIGGNIAACLSLQEIDIGVDDAIMIHIFLKKLQAANAWRLPTIHSVTWRLIRNQQIEDLAGLASVLLRHKDVFPGLRKLHIYVECVRASKAFSIHWSFALRQLESITDVVIQAKNPKGRVI